MSNIPQHLKRYIRNQITVDEDALIKLLESKEKEIEGLKKEIEKLKGIISMMETNNFLNT